MAETESMADPRVTRVDGIDGSFHVESRTRPGLEHTVNVPEETCTCEAGQHGVACWHLDFCRAVYYWHRYDQRAQLWAERAARLATTKAKRQAGLSAATAALQECYPNPAL